MPRRRVRKAQNERNRLRWVRTRNVVAADAGGTVGEADVDDPTLYTMREAARLKGVSYHTVSRALRFGRLPARRLGRQALITADDLAVWQPMRQRVPKKYRRDADPTAEVARERRVLEHRLVTLVTTAASGLSLVNLRVLCDGLAALVEELDERPVRQQGQEEDAAPPDRANSGPT